MMNPGSGNTGNTGGYQNPRTIYPAGVGGGYYGPPRPGVPPPDPSLPGGMPGQPTQPPMASSPFQSSLSGTPESMARAALLRQLGGGVR